MQTCAAPSVVRWSSHQKSSCRMRTRTTAKTRTPRVPSARRPAPVLCADLHGQDDEGHDRREHGVQGRRVHGDRERARRSKSKARGRPTVRSRRRKCRLIHKELTDRVEHKGCRRGRVWQHTASTIGCRQFGEPGDAGRNQRNAAENWWTAGGSNSRPPRCERGALPTELAAH